METLTIAELRQLAETRDDYCVSILMPTHRSGRETQQDPLRLKGLLNRVEKRLAQTRLRTPEVRRLLEPSWRLHSDGEFWAHQADGLALYLHAGELQTFRVPCRIEELAVVGSLFHITPLFPLVNEDLAFYILALSPKRVRMLRATRDTVKRVEVSDLPEDMTALTQYVDAERQLQFHTGAVPTALGGQARAAAFHGHGVGTDGAQAKKELLDFCHMLDRALQPTLAKTRAPVVLAGDVAFLSLFRKTASCRNLLDDVVSTSPDDLSDQQLREAAWPLVRRTTAAIQLRKLSEFGNAATKGQGATELAQILLAAVDGRVGTLLVATGSHVWGRFHADDRSTEVHEERREADEDLINTAAVTAYVNGAKVYAFPADQMPDGSPIAAVYRY